MDHPTVTMKRIVLKDDDTYSFMSLPLAIEPASPRKI